MTKRIGIDLGTTNSCVAWVDPSTDEPRVFLDDQKFPLLPSVLVQDRNGVILVGRQARLSKDALFRHAFVKRYLGTNTRFPLKDGEYTAASISAHFLRALKERAQKALDSEVQAVITVPAHFQENHLQETRQAANEAGLELLDIVREPCAAALAYYHDERHRGGNKPDSQILVYDLGGGTMDGTLCLRQGDHIEVGGNGRAYDGDKYLGGLDFDKALLTLAVSQLAEQGIDLVQESLSESLPRASWLWQLLLSAERMKHELTAETIAHWTAEIVVDDRGGALDFWVDRSQFEELIASKVEQTLKYCDNAIFIHADTCSHFANLSDEERFKRVVQELDSIVLVGGSTRVPYIREKIQDYYRKIAGDTVKVQSFRVDESVAIGAAIYASMLSTGSSTKHAHQDIQWLGDGPREQVGQDVTRHDQLHGTVLACTGAGWSVELSVGEEISQRVEVAPDGSFVLSGFSLQSGENHLKFIVRDASDTICGQQSHTVRRGGLSVDPAGLARPIQMRLVDGMCDLLRKGSHPGVKQTEQLYINDTSPIVRVPLYEGHHPIGLIELPLQDLTPNAEIDPGTKVIFQTSYRPGLLDVQVQVGTLPPQAREVAFQSLDVSSERAVLWQRFQDLHVSINEAFREIPDGGHFTATFQKQYQLLVLDIQTDFENPLLDLARIDDRLRQLDQLDFYIRTFPNTAEGLKLQIEGLRQQIVAIDDEQNLHLLRQLDELEHKLPSDGNQEITAALRKRLYQTKRQFVSGNPPLVSAEDLAQIKQRMQYRLQVIRESCGGDTGVIETVTAIETSMERLFHEAPSNETLYNRLWELEFGHLNDLYHDVVVKRSQQGLLRSHA